MTGTQNHECLAGTKAAIDYLADLGQSISAGASRSRRELLKSAYQGIRQYESRLTHRLVEGLQAIGGK